MTENNVVEEIKDEVIPVDAEMEEPETKEYAGDEEGPRTTQGDAPTPAEPARPGLAIVFKSEFKTALEETIGTLGYDRVIGSPEINVHVNQIFDVLNQVLGQPLTEDQANQFINMVAKAPYNLIANVMENVKTNQGEYFDVRPWSELGVGAAATEETKE